MNKHMRLVVSALFIVIILLAVAITRFYSNTEKSAGKGDSQPSITQRLGTDSSGNRVFKDSSGLCGIIDASDRIIVSPEWEELTFAEDNTCIASARLKGKKLFGCIDYEGNITVPFIYSDIKRIDAGSMVYYIAEAEADGSAVVYDTGFVPCLPGAWDEYSAEGSELTLVSGNGEYIYSASEAGFVLTGARLTGNTMGCGYELDITSRILLSKLTVPMLEKMSSVTAAYIEYAYTEDSELLADIDPDGKAVFLPLFPEEHSITSEKLMGIKDIFLYSVRSEDDEPHYAVSVTADTSVAYKDDEGKIKRLRGDYKAEVEFKGSSADKLFAVSGSFLQARPDYPQPESEETTTAPAQGQ